MPRFWQTHVQEDVRAQRLAKAKKARETFMAKLAADKATKAAKEKATDTAESVATEAPSLAADAKSSASAKAVSQTAAKANAMDSDSGSDKESDKPSDSDSDSDSASESAAVASARKRSAKRKRYASTGAVLPPFLRAVKPCRMRVAFVRWFSTTPDHTARFAPRL